jgi:hypothetical protein
MQKADRMIKMAKLRNFTGILSSRSLLRVKNITVTDKSGIMNGWSSVKLI